MEMSGKLHVPATVLPGREPWELKWIIKFVSAVMLFCLGMTESRTEFKLKTPPEDGISSVKFGPNSAQFLLVSSWDDTVRLYDVLTNNMKLKYTHYCPVLDVCFQVRWLTVLLHCKFTGVLWFFRKERWSLQYCYICLVACPIINLEPFGRLSGPSPFYFYFSVSNNPVW